MSVCNNFGYYGKLRRAHLYFIFHKNRKRNKTRKQRSGIIYIGKEGRFEKIGPRMLSPRLCRADLGWNVYFGLANFGKIASEFGGAPKERRRRRAEKRSSKRVFLESPFPLCPLKVFMCFKRKPQGGREETDSPKTPFWTTVFSARRLRRSFGPLWEFLSEFWWRFFFLRIFWPCFPRV